MGGSRHARPGSGFFGDGEDTWKAGVGDFVHALQESNSVEVLAAAEFVGDPLTGFARIIEIDHGGDGVHAEAVDVVLVEPEEGVGDEIVLNLIAAVVVDQRSPVGMRALAGVGVLVEMGAIELGEAVGVAGEVGGSPIQENADAGTVTTVDEFHQFGGRAVAAGGGEVAKGLVAPGAIVGVLHAGKELDVGVPEFFDVGDELVAKLAVSEPAVVVVWDAAPGAKMDFVDRDRRFEPVFLGALLHPRGILPLVGVEVGNYRASAGAQFGAKAVGVVFEGQYGAVSADDFILVDCAFVEFRHEELPDSRRAASAHGVDTAVPVVEIADNTYAAGARRPDREMDATDAFEGFDVRAEFFISVVVAAFAHEMEIEFAEEIGKSVGVESFKGFAVIGAVTDAVGSGTRRGLIRVGQDGFEKALGAQLGCGDFLRGALENHAGFGGVRLKKTNDPAMPGRRPNGVGPEKSERIGVTPGQQRVDLRVLLRLRSASLRGERRSCLFFGHAVSARGEWE